MKKLLTITSIFAAGTLVMNAATTLYFDNISTITSNTTAGSWTQSDGTESTLLTYVPNANYNYILTTDTSVYDKITYTKSANSSGMFVQTTANSSTYLASNFSFVLDLTAIKAAATTQDASTIGLISWRYEGKNEASTGYNLTGAIGLAATSTGIQATWEGALWSSSGTVTWATLESLTKSIAVDANGHSQILLTLSVNGAKGTTVYDATGTALSTGTDADGNATTMSYAKLCGSDTTTSNNTMKKDLAINDTYISGVAVTAAEGITAAQISAIAVHYAIPEPSMFGLLAGTLALGLAGTRRRRHAK